MLFRFGDTDLHLVQGDLLKQDVEAIVNPANEKLKHGGGVAGLIVQHGGASIQEESDRIGFCRVGGAVVTSAGTLSADFVIHAVGPRWGEGEEDQKLSAAVTSVFDRMEEKKIESVAMPAISTGIFGFPLERAAGVILKTLRSRLGRGVGIRKVLLCLYDSEAFSTFTQTAREIYD